MRGRRSGGFVGKGREDGSNFDIIFWQSIAEDGELIGLGLGLEFETFTVQFGVRGVWTGN